MDRFREPEMKKVGKEGDVEEYISEFEFLSSQVNCLPEEQYLGYFVGGLKPEIRVRVRTLKGLGPQSISLYLKKRGQWLNMSLLRTY